jgi:hypothetical protein
MSISNFNCCNHKSKKKKKQFSYFGVLWKLFFCLLLGENINYSRGDTGETKYYYAFLNKKGVILKSVLTNKYVEI